MCGKILEENRMWKPKNGPGKPAETSAPKPWWPKYSLFLSVFLWLLAWEAIVWFIPAQPRLVIRTNQFLMGFSPDGTTLVTASDPILSLSSTIYHLWDTGTGQHLGTIGDGDRNILPNVVYSSQRNLLGELAFDFDSKRGFSLYDLRSRKETGTVDLGQDAGGEIVDLCFSIDGGTLACSVRSRTKTRLRVIDVATRQVYVDLEGGRFEEFALSHDGTFLATTRTIAKTNENIPDEQNLIVLDLARGKTWTIVQNHGEGAMRLAISPDGTMLAAHCVLGNSDLGGINDEKIRVWEVKTGKQIASFDGRGPRFPEFLPDGRRLTLWDDNSVTFLDLAAGKEIARSQSRGTAANPIPGSRPWVLRTKTRQYSEPGLIRRWCATYLGMKEWGKEKLTQEVTFLDTDTGEKVAGIVRPTVIDVQVCPDGKMLALWTYKNDESVIEIWDIPPRKPLRWVLGLLAIPSVVTFFTIWRWWKAVSRTDVRIT